MKSWYNFQIIHTILLFIQNFEIESIARPC